jgi:hypothetical protein
LTDQTRGHGSIPSRSIAGRHANVSWGPARGSVRPGRHTGGFKRSRRVGRPRDGGSPSLQRIMNRGHANMCLAGIKNDSTRAAGGGDPAAGGRGVN